MILNFKGEATLESLLADKGITNAVKCGSCLNPVAFDDSDIVYIAINNTIERGFIRCPWCGHEIFVAERQDSIFGKMIARQHYTTIDSLPRSANYQEE